MALTIDDIVKVSVDTAAMAVTGQAFNVGLIIGPTVVTGITDRVTLYSSVSEMLEAGYQTTDPEYAAAALYFAQSPMPGKVAIGTKQANETVLAALTACRASGVDWYAFTFTQAIEAALEDEDVAGIAAFVEASDIYTVWFHLVTASSYTTKMSALKSAGYMRTMAIYSSGTATITAGIMGRAMGLNYDGSPAFNLAYKAIAGATPESTLTAANLNAILNANGNVYVQQGSYYNLFRQGKMANGFAFDDVLMADMLANKIQTEVMNTLTAENKIPQTDEGVQILMNVISGPCEEMLSRGYLAPGVWNRNSVLTLARGDMLTKGYKIMTTSVNDQSQTDRDARKAPPIYVCVKTAGAIEYVVLAITVNR